MIEVKDTAVLQHRGAIHPAKVIPLIQRGDYSFVEQQKMGYHLSYSTAQLGFHVVDRFASLPLFYVMHEDKPIVSEVVDELLPYLSTVTLDPIGYYSTGGMEKGERSHRTPFKGILRIPPGHYLEYKNGQTNLHCYWAFTHLKGKAFQGTYEEACEELGYLIRQGVQRCYEFVPNTALHLSGGLDSGSITAIICQLSNQARSTYAILKEGAPLLHDRYESGFLGKYQQHYPQLQIAYSYNFDSIKRSQERIAGAGNWHYCSQQNIEIDFCQDVQAKGKQHILTGMGGDELASYGHGFQNVGYSLHNDRQAQLYMDWKIGRLRRWRFRAKALLGKDGNVMDSLRSTQMTKLIANAAYWYTPAFQKAAAEWMERPPISLYWYPSSYDYRLETLDRSYLSIRSDIWNFIGRTYGITYLHPLLDADLVDFCARLPRHFFRHRGHREMIKTALKNQLPADLLQGTKRPGYYKGTLEAATIRQQVKKTQDSLAAYHTTFAASVYDYQKMSQVLAKFEKQLQGLPDSHQQTLAGIRRWTGTVGRLQWKGDYLNTYF